MHQTKFTDTVQTHFILNNFFQKSCPLWQATHMYIEFAVEAHIGKPPSCMCAYTFACWMHLCVCVPTHNYAGCKQISFRIMTVERYMTLDKAEHNAANTRHLILAAVMWLSCRCGNSRHIWPLSTKFWVNRQIIIKPPQSNLTRIRPLQAAVIYAVSWTDSHGEGSRLFCCLCERA
jgi:hypothetical protein